MVTYLSCWVCCFFIFASRSKGKAASRATARPPGGPSLRTRYRECDDWRSWAGLQTFEDRAAALESWRRPAAGPWRSGAAATQCARQAAFIRRKIRVTCVTLMLVPRVLGSRDTKDGHRVRPEGLEGSLRGSGQLPEHHNERAGVAGPLSDGQLCFFPGEEKAAI